jgi:hypothetical protein
MAQQKKSGYTVADFLPLIIIFSIIIAFVIIRQLYMGWGMNSAMYDTMGAFFIIFGAFKIINLSAFADAYQIYDIIAQRSRAYAFVYPFIEVALGIAYFARYNLFLTNIVTLLLMIVSSIGVGREVMQGNKIPCACLGMVFRIPMTYVTLIEDVTMACMAAYMLLIA